MPYPFRIRFSWALYLVEILSLVLASYDVSDSCYVGEQAYSELTACLAGRSPVSKSSGE